MRHYEVLAPTSVNGYDGYMVIGVIQASSARAAANKALRALAEDPWDSEGAAVLSPDPTIIAVPMRRMIPLEGLRIPQEIVDAFVLGDQP